jgi:hypothetical protein
MSGSPADGRRSDRAVHLELEGFAWEAVHEECSRLGVSVEDLITFATLYYLADVDSGRIARRISRNPYPNADTLP